MTSDTQDPTPGTPNSDSAQPSPWGEGDASAKQADSGPEDTPKDASENGTKKDGLNDESQKLSDTKSADKSRDGGGLLWALILLVLFGAGAWVMREQWLPHAKGYLPANIIALLQDVEPSVDANVSAPAPAPQPQLSSPTPSDAAVPAQTDETRTPQAVVEQTQGDVAPSTPAQASNVTPTETPTEAPVESTAVTPAEVSGGASGDVSGEVSGEVVALQSRIEALEITVAGLNQQNAILTERIKTLSVARPSEPVLDPMVNSTLEALQTRLAQLETASETRTDVQVERQLLALAAGRLATVIDGGRPFATELAGLVNAAQPVLAPEAVAEIKTRLEPFAVHGVKTRAALKRAFVPISRDVLRAQARGTDDGIWGAVKAKLADLVVVRRTDGADADGADFVLARTEAALADDDIAMAIETLGTLQGAPVETIGAWVADAQARIEAERALSLLEQQMLSASPASAATTAR